MPREKAFRCKRCGELYVDARCPNCRKRASVRSGAGRRRYGSGGGRRGPGRHWSASDVLGHSSRPEDGEMDDLENEPDVVKSSDSENDGAGLDQARAQRAADFSLKG